MHGMDGTSTAKVSNRGQTNVPAALRRRWNLMEGGELGFIDLGGAALIVTGGEAAARRELRRVLRDRYEAALLQIDLPELADQ